MFQIERGFGKNFKTFTLVMQSPITSWSELKKFQQNCVVYCIFENLICHVAFILNVHTILFYICFLKLIGYINSEKNIAILCTMHASKISVILHDYALENIYNFYWSSGYVIGCTRCRYFICVVSCVYFFSNRIRSENKIFVWWIQTNIPDSLSWLSRRKVFSIKNFF